MPRRGTLIVFGPREDAPDAYPVPNAPEGWAVRRESNGLATVWPLGTEGASVIGGELRAHAGVFFHAWWVQSHATLPRALFVCVGHPWVLERLADFIAASKLAWARTWASLGELRGDGTAVAVALRAAWPAAEIDGGAVRLLRRVAGFDDDDAEGGA